MAEQRLAIGIDPKALADFGAQFAGQKVQELVASARSTGSSQAGPRRRVVHHDEILVALFGIGHVGLVSDADDDRLADVIIFLNPPRFGKGREDGIAVESIKDRLSGPRWFSHAGEGNEDAIPLAAVRP